MKFAYLFFTLLLGCKVPITKKIVEMNPNFDFQGHRGCRGLLPENTIAAFIKAIDLGVTTLEMDVVISKDNEVVVSHEPFFNHEISTQPNGLFIEESDEKNHNIFTMNYDEIKRYDVGIKPHPRFAHQQKINAVKPLLRDVIDSVERYIVQNNLNPVQYNIETKCKPSTDGLFHPLPSKFIDLLLQVIVNKKIEQKTIIQSFDTRTLQYLHRVNTSIKTAYLFEGVSITSFEKRIIDVGFTPTIYSPSYQLVNKKLVNSCHEKGIKIIPWTVNDVKEIQRLIAMGVDGIITDYPNLIATLK